MHAPADEQDLPPSQAAARLIAAHPGLSAQSVHVTDVPGLGLAALIQVTDRPALRAWAQALHATGHTTGASAYGTHDPHRTPGLHQWWQMTFLDITVDDRPVRLWTLDTTHHRALPLFLAATAHTPKR
ncbi:hypothetical protein [Streptomyces sp. NPDC020489]|uniref:hypothetical protein n=1 Tax=Streptomyces sp. NPDC020489 TaxID=3365077 RepID=UPI003791CB38